MRDDVLILIPARGGSRGIPRKNLRFLAGFPLVQWAITSAQRSGIGSVFVTSEDQEVIALAKSLWAGFIERPAALAQDETPDLLVFHHALDFLSPGRRPQILVHLRPTAPFVKPEEIRDMVTLLSARKNLSAIRSVVPACCHPRKCYANGPDFGGPTLRPYTDRHAANHPRQDLERVWKAAGFLDAFRIWCLTSSPNAPDGHMIGRWDAPPDRALDIDTQADWDKAELLAKANGWRPGEIQ